MSQGSSKIRFTCYGPRVGLLEVEIWNGIYPPATLPSNWFEDNTPRFHQIDFIVGRRTTNGQSPTYYVIARSVEVALQEFGRSGNRAGMEVFLQFLVEDDWQDGSCGILQRRTGRAPLSDEQLAEIAAKLESVLKQDPR